MLKCWSQRFFRSHNNAIFFEPRSSNNLDLKLGYFEVRFSLQTCLNDFCNFCYDSRWESFCELVVEPTLIIPILNLTVKLFEPKCLGQLTAHTEKSADIVCLIYIFQASQKHSYRGLMLSSVIFPKNQYKFQL